MYMISVAFGRKSYKIFLDLEVDIRIFDKTGGFPHIVYTSD